MEENLFLFRRFRLLDQAGKQRVDQQFQDVYKRQAVVSELPGRVKKM